VLTMPPVPSWFKGRTSIDAFLRTFLFAGDAAQRFRLLPTRANGCPAFATYTRGEDGAYRPGALQVLNFDGEYIAELHDFLAVDDRLFARFGLAPTL
jgi:RNA polymerase sigma-70 factor (ECF subfamily)